MILSIAKIIAALSLFFIIVFLTFSLFIQYKQTNKYHGPVTDHFDGERFHNLLPYQTHHFLDIWRWKLTNDKQQWPQKVNNTFEPDVTFVKDNAIKVTYVNHASVLVQTKTLTFLTDPVWSYRVSPVSWTGPHRVREPGIAFNALPKIDVVLITHNHYDHMDVATLKQLAQHFNPVIIVPLGNKKVLEKNGINNVIELDWWQSYRIGHDIITLLPTQHWSARWLTDRFKTLWGSYGIEVPNKKIYFAGDTGYSKNFDLIKQRWGKPDLAFLPIGSYKPEWFMQSNHMNPREALQAHQDLNAKASIAIHFGTFQLSDEGIDEPVKDLQNALSENAHLENEFLVLGVGETRVFKN